jgi:hypothetical protein
MANISSYFGGSGGGSLSTDFTKNAYGVPFPEYITSVDYKNSCTVTVCPGTAMCCNGISQGGIINVKDNIFIAVAVESGLGGTQDCTRAYAMAFCVNDDTGAITSGMTEFTCIFQSASVNDRFAGEVDTRSIGDGCCRVYMTYSCNGNARVKVLCTNASFNCVSATCTTGWTGSSSATLTYNGVPGQVLAHSPSPEKCLCVIYFCDGNICRNGGTSVNTCNLSGDNTGKSHFVLSPNTIIQHAICMCGGDCACFKTVLQTWNPTSNDYRMAYCIADGQGLIGNNNFRCALVCCMSPGKILEKGFRVGPTWYPEGGNASWFTAGTDDQCYQKWTCCNTCSSFDPTSALLNWKGQAAWQATVKGYSGHMQAYGSLSDLGTDITVDLQYNLYSCIQDRNPKLITQQNGVLAMGMFAQGCCHYNCGQFFSGFKHDGFGSWAREQDINLLVNTSGIPVKQYPKPVHCNCYYTSCFHFLGSQVVGNKWIVSMEAARCGLCECITLHSYKMMTNSCTAG